MIPPSQLNAGDFESPVQYGTEAFPRRLETLMATGEGRSAARVLFYGGIREERQQALATLTRHTTANVHQFRVPSLLADRRTQTQNNLRKAFDHAAEESALLYFDEVDLLFTHTHSDTPDASSESSVPTTAEYFFDRVVAYEGTVVLGLQDKSHVEWAQDKAHLVVSFD